jgi:hypothetical protein
MNASALTAADYERRTAAIRRLERVAIEMDWVRAQIRAASSSDNVALSPLAIAARAGWMNAQAALIQADGGMRSPSMIKAIGEPGTVDSASLRNLSLSTLIAAEGRLTGQPPMPATLAQGGGR